MKLYPPKKGIYPKRKNYAKKTYSQKQIDYLVNFFKTREKVISEEHETDLTKL